MEKTTVDVIAANALLTKFKKEQIFHDVLRESGKYPVVVYKDISETPVLHADDALYGYEHIIRVTIVTNSNSGINELKSAVFDCMTDAGFMWQNTNKVNDDGEFYTAMDFSVGVLK